MNKIKDTFTFKLTFFAFILAVIFLYFFRIEKSKELYNNYKNSLDDLIISNLKLDNFLSQKEKFFNFDNIVAQTNLFESSLTALLESNIKTEFGKDIYRKIVYINESFKKKDYLVEKFKSKQASSLNSAHFIYDLNQYLLNDVSLNEELKLLINSTLFMIMQEFININLNEKAISQNLKEIEKFNFNNNRLDLMIKHVKNIQANVRTILEIKLEANNLEIGKKLRELKLDLIKRYNEKLFYQWMISIFSFLIIILSFIIIYLEHRKSQKVKKELAAFKYAVENSDNSIILTDTKKNILYVNDIFEKTTGFNKEEVFGNKPKILQSGETPLQTYADLNKSLESGKKWEGEFINKKKDGSIFYEKASIVPVVLDDEISNYLAIKLDITEYILQNESLKLSATVFENIQEGILVLDSSKKILTVNKAFETMTGYTKENILGKTPMFLKSEYHDMIFYKKVEEELAQKGRFKGKIFGKKNNGGVIPFWVNISTIKDKKDQVSRYIVVCTSLEEIIETQKKADFLAYHDSLTKLPNRVKFENDLEFSINIAKRRNHNLFVLFIDLDRFKMINDSLGHVVGDELLKIISSRIKEVLRDSDIIARMGGDEFIVVLDSTRDKNAASYVCQKILNIIKKPIEVEDNILNTSASIGIAVYPDDGRDITTLIKNADTAMYHAKNLGKNNYQYYNKQLSLNVNEQLQIEQALKKAISNNEIYLNYQPQYDLVSRKITAFEALARWESDELGFIPPDKFIPIAEDTGLIIDIGKHIFETACKAYIEFKSLNPSLKYIAINISSVQFKDKNFVDDILEIVSTYKIKPSEIELEVTERYVMEYSESNLNSMQQFRDLGFRFSIDDFGTGYSSMSYLTKFPIDVIKVDKAFIDGIPKDNNNVLISKAIVALSKSLNYKVVAEGIEEKVQEDFLKSISCDIGQGYFFSKPLNLEAAKKILKT
ncbi:EAL domain-containing protein [Halarcobacter anaerophilus]|uniref:EAL domain-containing protein n=1 Tax=Halarcobacter anaerophilus TaxID=877500 RepID=UPI00069793F7|nr:EAL domain-containing protein [Halarcobacter anaerophilus]